jgi:predicted TIM-barrel enzyme
MGHLWLLRHNTKRTVVKMSVAELNDIRPTPVMFIQKLDSFLFSYRFLCKIKNALGAVIQLVCNFRTQTFFQGQYGLFASSKKRDMS